MESLNELIFRINPQKIIYILLLVDWVFYIPIFPSMFAKEKKFLYKENLLISFLFALIWLISILTLIYSNEHSMNLFASIILFSIFRYVFIYKRWKSVRRGFGAPGFMSYWVITWIMLINLTSISLFIPYKDPVFFLMKFDFAVIMICAGTYKAFVGYLKNDGMELGASNFLWGHFYNYFSRINLENYFHRIMNILGSIIEIIAGILILCPTVYIQNIGLILISISFLYIFLLIRLGRLALIMVVIPLILMTNNNYTINNLFEFNTVNTIIYVVIFFVLLIKVYQYLILFSKYKFDGFLSSFLMKLSNFIPIIVWRVFTPDVTNFAIEVFGSNDKYNGYIDVYTRNETYNYLRWKFFWRKIRGLHVTESIAIVSGVFNMKKYFPSKKELFLQRIIVYSKSLSGFGFKKYKFFKFNYFQICKENGIIKYELKKTYIVDITKDFCEEVLIDPKFDDQKLANLSPVKESIAFGSLIRKK